MQLTVIFVTILGLAVGGNISPTEEKGPHHSTKKELKEPNRFPRKIQQSESKGSGTDVDPALVYALPPVGLLHQGRGFGYGLGGAGAAGYSGAGADYGGAGAGYDAAAFASLLRGGLQEGKHEVLVQEKKPVYHAAPVDFGSLLANHVTPVQEVKDEDGSQGGGALQSLGGQGGGILHSLGSQSSSAYHTAHAVQEAAQSFVNAPKYYGHDQHEDEYKDYAAKYQFGYRVRDLHTGNDFGQTESRDGHLTQGHYHVLLPDGRLQNVHYWSDHSGFHAKVSYNGFSHH